jgi:uncharacterized membrane protein
METKFGGLVRINPEPLTKKGKNLLYLTLLAIIALWLLAIYGYTVLPDRVPTHFGIKGEPDSYGSKAIILLLPLIFSLGPVIILIIVHFRFSLINSYSYLMSLPAFFSNLHQIPEERRGFWVNRYFEEVLGLVAFLTIYFLILEIGIYIGMLKERLPHWFLPFTILFPIVLLVIFIVNLKKLSKEFVSEVYRG